MDDAMKRKQAKTVYQTICQVLDAEDWHYKKDEEKLTIECGAKGEDLPIELTIKVDADRQLVRVISMLPFTFPEDRRLNAAMAVSVVNNKLVHGCFDCSLPDGFVFFRICTTYRESLLSQEAVMYLILVACSTVDAYNDKFLMLSKDTLTLEQFIKAENK
ncbi:MAG: hypothetical protein IJO45_04415 [Oscillospiraceae bacterium]|nr:hypothetical protein [Oscillospiraceae bacterium]